MAIKIFIDQGHNPSGPNTGAEGFGLKEQDITYQVGRTSGDQQCDKSGGKGASGKCMAGRLFCQYSC